MSAIQYAVNLATAPVIKDPYIVWAFAGPSIVGFFSAIAFWFIFKDLDKEEYVISDNDMGEVDEDAQRREGDYEMGAAKDAEVREGKNLRQRMSIHESREL